MIVAVGLGVLAGTAAADDTFVPGHVTLRAANELGAHTDSLAFDGFYAVNDRFELGVTSSTEARRELGAGRGLCLHGCSDRYAGLAVDAQVRLAPNVTGRAAIDMLRFAPTAAALELGVDGQLEIGPVYALIAPVLHLGITRRDLANQDVAATLAHLELRVLRTQRGSIGVLGELRIGLALDDVSATPAVGAAGGVVVRTGAFTLSVRAGHSDSLFGELALGWSS